MNGYKPILATFVMTVVGIVMLILVAAIPVEASYREGHGAAYPVPTVYDPYPYPVPLPTYDPYPYPVPLPTYDPYPYPVPLPTYDPYPYPIIRTVDRDEPPKYRIRIQP